MFSTPALAVSTLYFVQGTGDAPTAGCAPIDGTSLRCDSLRAAVAAANAMQSGADESDVIFLQRRGPTS